MDINPRFEYPPPIARTLGFDLVEAGERTATIEIVVDLAKHANPMGTVHGGVLCDVADAAIGTAHGTGLAKEKASRASTCKSISSVLSGTIGFAQIARPVHLGKTVSRYVCDILNYDGRLVAQVSSTVMTLRGEKASGR